MLYLEEHAGWLLVLHAVLGAAVVSISTHLVVWLRGLPAGHTGRLRAARRFAWLSLAGYVAAFALGNLIYPVYKARVRIEYLENPPAIDVAIATRGASGAAMAELTGASPPAELRDADEVARLARVARWFDVKEQWVLVGLLMALTCAAVLATWEPVRDGPGPLPLVIGCAAGAAVIAWTGALIGLMTAAVRAIG